MADIKAIAPDHIQSVFQYRLLLLNGCHAGVYVKEQDQYQYEDYNLQDDA